MKKRFVLTILLLFGVLCIGSSTVGAKEKTVGAFRYHYTSLTKNTCQITQVDVLKKKQAGVLKFPDTLGGKKVVKIGDKNDGKWVELGTNIFGVEMNDAGGYSPYEAHSASKCVKEVYLPSTLKELTKNCFSMLPNLKKITVTSGMNKTVEYLCDMKWKSFKISPKNQYYKVSNGLLLSKNGKTVYGLVKNTRNIRLPSGAKKIKKYAFWGEDIDSIYLPKSIDVIEDGALQIATVAEISVSKKNKHYAMSGDCLYSKKSGRLVAAINRDNKLVIPSVVKKLQDGTSAIGGKFHEIIIPKSVKTLGSYWGHGFFESYEDGIYGVFRFKGTVPPKIEENGMLANIVYVPAESQQAYEKVLKGFGVEIRTTK